MTNFIAKILGFIDTKIKIDGGGGNIKTASLYSSAGDDSLPLSTDHVVAISIAQSGAVVVVGIKNKITVKPGEKKIFSRQANGEIAASIYLKENGVIHGENKFGYFELTETGQFVVNGVVIG